MGDLDLTIFGKRVKDIRDNILHMTQQTFADEVGTNQVLLSRLEKGLGGNINLIFAIVNFLDRKGFKGSMLFDREFDMGLLSGKNQHHDQGIANQIIQVKSLTQNFYEEILKIANS